MQKLKRFLQGLGGEVGQRAFAEACGVTLGHLRNVMYGLRTFSPELAVAIERESSGAVVCDDLLPGVRWVRVADRSWPHKRGRPLVDVAAGLPA